MEHSTVRALLESLAETPQPATSVDISRAAFAGRRAMRLRRLAAVGSAVLISAAVVVTVGVVALGTTALRPARQPAGSSVAPSAPVAPLPAEAPKAFDPVVQYADFGWLPDGLSDRIVRTEPNYQSLTATQPVISTPCSTQDPPSSPTCLTVDEPARVVLATVPAGHTIPAGPTATAGRTPTVTDAEPVNGRPARWGDSSLGTPLQWEYAPGAWAEVSVWNVGDPKQVARRLAETVRFGVDLPIRVPIRVTGLPGTIRPVGLSVSRSTIPSRAHWSAELHFSDTGQRTKFGDWPLSLMAMLSSARTGDGRVLGDPNTTLDRYPARRTNGLDGGKGLQVYDVNGVYLELSTHSSAMTKQLPGGLDGLFRSLEISKEFANWY